MTEFETHNSPASPESPVQLRPPAVSVVIPAYIAAGYISSTLNSVFAQSFSDFEVLVINDGSPDTVTLEQQLKPHLSRIRYFKQANRGPSAARNLGIREAKGHYIAFLDADDFWLPSHLGRQVQRLILNPKLGLVYANAFHLRENILLGTAFDHVPQSGVADLNSLLSEQCTINTSSVVALRSALFQAGLFEESLNHCEDFDLWLRLARLGFAIEYDREVQVGHRLGNGLAADRGRMKEGRARAYKRFLENGDASESERRIIESKLATLDFELHVELAKKLLLDKRYREARNEVRAARSTVGEGKLRLAALGLRCFPSGLRFAYRVYVNLLGRYNKSRETHSINPVSQRELLQFFAAAGGNNRPLD